MIGRLLGVDHGKARIGLAISDALGISARELQILDCRGEQDDIARIVAIAERENVAGIVVGVPYNPNAPAGLRAQADLVLAWTAKLREATPLPVAEAGEYLSSAEARQLARQLKRGAREPVDDLAARVILQAYLDALSYGAVAFPPAAPPP